ncbi:MAG: SPFH domain-containing protein, partial [Candidatus Brocadiia bacterium]|nr:SPFH domain-containing protein [Candidatus Brocadiia bacterium]
IKDPLVGVGGLAGVAFFGLLVGKYCVALAHSARFRLLRASGSFMLGNAASSFLVVCSLVMVQFGVGWLEVAMAFVLPGLMGLIAVEIVLNMVLDIYRPRVPGQEVRPHYDSRLLGLIAAPGSMVKTIASTLDYQFGFKVSETWFYRFMGRAIIPLFLVQIIALWLLSCMVIVNPDEIAFIEQFGKPILTKADAERELQATIYPSGVRFKAPWPIQTARKVPAYRLLRKEIGKIRYGRGERSGHLPQGVMEMSDPDYVLWDEVHIDPKIGFEVSFLSPGSVEAGAGTDTPPVNIAFLEAQVHYRVKRTPDGRGVDEKAAYRFYYGHRDPELLLETLAYAVVTRLAARQNFLEWMNVKREEISKQFRDDLQNELDERGMGLEIVYAGIPVVHPPPETARAFEGVGSAYQEMEKLKHIGRGQAARIVGEARGEAAQTLSAASVFGIRLSKVAGAEAERFAIQAQTYRLGHRVYLHRLYLRALEDILRGHRVYVLPVRANVGMDLDLTTTQPGITGGIDLEEHF